MITYIYKVTSPSGKVYIGITVNFLNRKQAHIDNASRYDVVSKFYTAIKKYGKQLKWDIIDEAANWEVACELEKRYILHFDSYISGYNMTLGGEGATKYEIEDIENIAKCYNSKNDWKEGKDRYSYLIARNAIKSGIKNEKWWNSITSHMTIKCDICSKDFISSCSRNSLCSK